MDIVEIFDKPDHVESFTYDLNFPKHGYDKSFLDTWVLSSFEKFYAARSDVSKKSNQLFFFHLMGSGKWSQERVSSRLRKDCVWRHLKDTNGHKHGGASDEYRNNARVADDIIRKIEKLIETWDGKTSYIVTADHGHVDKGNIQIVGRRISDVSGGHGSDSVEETTSPFAAWGPAFVNKETGKCTYESWDELGLGIDQRSIAPLVSAVLSNQDSGYQPKSLSAAIL